eukprot:scaffold26981_cov157-Cylindrotheca_fusiformis.AAC.2
MLIVSVHEGCNQRHLLSNRLSWIYVEDGVSSIATENVSVEDLPTALRTMSTARTSQTGHESKTERSQHANESWGGKAHYLFGKRSKLEILNTLFCKKRARSCDKRILLAEKEKRRRQINGPSLMIYPFQY